MKLQEVTLRACPYPVREVLASLSKYQGCRLSRRSYARTRCFMASCNDNVNQQQQLRGIILDFYAWQFVFSSPYVVFI